MVYWTVPEIKQLGEKKGNSFSFIIMIVKGLYLSPQCIFIHWLSMGHLGPTVLHKRFGNRRMQKTLRMNDFTVISSAESTRD